MKVNFNPAFKYNSTFSDFIQPSVERTQVYAQPTKDEIVTAKTKKAISECKYIVIALGILYFAMKRNFKINKIKNNQKQMEKLAKMKVPKKVLINVNPEKLMGLQ